MRVPNLKIFNGAEPKVGLQLLAMKMEVPIEVPAYWTMKLTLTWHSGDRLGLGRKG